MFNPPPAINPKPRMSRLSKKPVMSQQQKNDYMKMGLCDNAPNNKINFNKIYKMGNSNDYVRWGSNKTNGNGLQTLKKKDNKYLGE